MLKAIGLQKYFNGPRGKLEVLKNVNLELKEGEIAFILGRSGAGKSTLLHLLGGLDEPSGGKVEFDGKEIDFRNERFLADYRNRKIGFVFQFFHLLPELTVKENVQIPSVIAGRSRSKQAEALLKRVGLWERRDHLPSELSGGEQQRTAIARALVNEPRLVFCDEPTGNLDEQTAESVYQLILDLNREGHTFCIVTHEEGMVRKGDRALRLHEGVIEPRTPFDWERKGAVS